MSAFSVRKGAYKAGLLLLMLAFVVFSVGFCAPYWSVFTFDSSPTTYESFEGPWMVCLKVTTSAFYTSVSVSSCGNYGFDVVGWFHAVRAFAFAGGVALLIACIYGLVVNCCKTFPGPVSRLLEIFAILGGIFALISVIIYGAMRKKENHMGEGLTLGGYSFGAILGFVGSMEIGWALYLAGVGGGLALVAGIMIAVGNKDVRSETTNNGAVMGMSTVVSTTSTSQGYPPASQGYGYPPQAGYAGPVGYPGGVGYAGGYGAGYGQPQTQGGVGYGMPAKH